MAGYKQTIRDDNPVAFWTFDGDAFDPVNRNILVPIGEPKVIIDEMGNVNPATIMTDEEEWIGYRLGMPSLIEHEQEHNASIGFGFNGNVPQHPTGFPKSYLWVAHSASFAFSSFTIEFMFYKSGGADQGIAGTNWNSYTRPIMSKNGVFNIYFNYPFNAQNSITITHPGGTTTVLMTNSSIFKQSLYNRNIHFVFVWEQASPSSGTFTGTAKVYINGIIASDATTTYLDNPPVTNVNSPIFIAGTGGNNRRYDWHTNLFQMDQIAIYNKALTEAQIVNHAKKIWPYDVMIDNQGSNQYWTFSDLINYTNYKIMPFKGSREGDYIGGEARTIREHNGPASISNSKAAYFANGGHANFPLYSQSTGTAITNQINVPYSYEFWFKTGTSSRGVLLAATQTNFPFNGLLLQINTRNQQSMLGSVQFTESHTGYIFNSIFLNQSGSRWNFNDGKWHHVVMTRDSESVVSFYLDGILHDRSPNATVTVQQPGQITMMNCLPGINPVEGAICKFATYQYPLPEAVITSHYSYSMTYRIRGIVTLLGTPYQAMLRFYKSRTGEFVQELKSDVQTGEYMAVFPNNSNMDILVSNPADLSVRYRAYGPVTPAEFDDFPINI